NPHAIITITPDLKITNVNPAFSRIMGYTYEESIRMKLSDLRVLERDGGSISEGLQTKKPVFGKLIADSPVGIRHLQYVYIPILDKKGEVIKFLEIFSDLTEQRNLIAYYESILDAVPLPIHVTDTDMNWTYMNKPFETILQNNRVIQDRKSAYGKPCSNANANICKTNECGIHQLRTTGKNETFFDWMGASNKQTTAPVINASGETVGYVETVQDLTEQIRMIEFLQKEVARLSENIVRLSEGNFDLNMKMTESDKYSEKAKGMFEEINSSISTLVAALQNLIEDANNLANDATNGNLKARANIEQHHGEFRKIVEGLNQTLDSVILPINESLNVCENYASYDFTVRFSSSLDIKGDWIQFKNALNKIGESICDAISLINKNLYDLTNSAEEAHISVAEVVTGAQQVAVNTGKVSQNADQGGDGIVQVLKAMEDLNMTVSAVSQKAESVSVASDQANNLAKDGINLAHQSEKAMEDITHSAREVDTIVTGINTQMDEIGKIVRLISDIANQTNLLALNAAIEAARAGEAGRGFAVVAAEVKSLAQDSRKSAENIEDMIAALQTKAKQATQAMGKSNQAVQDGSAALGQTLTAFNKIADTIENINRNTVEVASASEEQAASVEEVTASIQEVSNLMQNTSHEAGDAAAATEEASASIDEVGRIINGVVGIVQNISEEMTKFKVE
ncbi:MAG TPA: methyl-accepting chemotaxis protein, partial [Methanospirillum sp.]|uniref:methyl-accepting chemotaxis protein n=1 Tax=Methanospirillum sp. TaxID=45200 RepID=UPI002BBC806E